jgi:hypothetical protein
VILLIIVVALGAVAWTTGANAAESTTQRDAPTVRFYTPDGKAAGTALTYGNTTRFYTPAGLPSGTARTTNGEHK